MFDWVYPLITTVLQWLEHHIYFMMFFAAFIEGETFLLLAGIEAAHSAHTRTPLHLPILILIAVIGSTLHDQLLFALGRFWGGPLLQRFPAVETKSIRVRKLIEKYDIWLVLALRYAYGLRTTIPIVLGMTAMGWRRFLVFDIIGGVLWSATFILGGYYFGIALRELFTRLSNYKGVIISVIAVLLLLLVSLLVYLRRRGRQKEMKQQS